MEKGGFQKSPPSLPGYPIVNYTDRETRKAYAWQGALGFRLCSVTAVPPCLGLITRVLRGTGPVSCMLPSGLAKKPGPSESGCPEATESCFGELCREAALSI